MSLRAKIHIFLGLSALPLCAEPVSFELSRENAVLRALENNFSIQIESIERPVAEENLKAAKGIYDPRLELEYDYTRQSIEGARRDAESSNASAGVRALLPTGTELFAGIDTSDTTSPLTDGSIDDSVSAFSGLTITQPLLRGFGFAGTGYRIRIARTALERSSAQVEATVATVINDTIAAFQNALFASKNLEIAIRNRELAKQLLSDNEVRVEMGVMAPLDRIQAEAEAALREVAVLNARNFEYQAMNTLKNLIFDDPDSIMEAELVLKESSSPEFSEPDFNADLGVALTQRPELMSAEASREIAEMELQTARRNALPSLNIVASYGRRAISDSFDDALSESFSDGEPASSIGAVFSVPFPNRSAKAERATAYLRRNQAVLTRNSTEQSIRIELGNAISDLKTDFQRIQAATQARDLAEQALDAEERKLQVGNSSTFIVLRLQGDLAIAEAREAAARSDYITSHANYLRAKGNLRSTFLNSDIDS